MPPPPPPEQLYINASTYIIALVEFCTNAPDSTQTPSRPAFSICWPMAIMKLNKKYKPPIITTTFSYLSGFDHCSYFVDLRQSNMFLAEMIHHLLEFIQNGQHSIVYINIGIIPITVTVASETPHVAWKAAHDGTFCSSWLFIRAYLVVYVQMKDLKWLGIPYFWFNSTWHYWIWPCTSVYRCDVNSVKFLKEFLIRYSISFCFTVVYSGGDGSPRCTKHIVWHGTYFPNL